MEAKFLSTFMFGSRNEFRFPGASTFWDLFFMCVEKCHIVDSLRV